ncbi:YtxH domain-containing protein [Patiriisocius marinus]|uniref:YtxH domain-containing protein n=1 Tax=Patiriisocius marinus TaxID=1397112 RepID=A0A5J4IX84_9FLAO|nr:YtxH domain-containing protein [Patiriisocius marinus]GER59574.1 hypothetical protein ULMA_16820 [Patiriisocius marinus]
MATRNNNGKGILALLGIGAGVFAWWKYKNLSPEEKARLKGKIDETGSKIKDTYAEVEDTISEKYEQVKNTIKKEINEAQS